MEIEFQCTVNDYKRFNWLYAKANAQKLIPLIILLPLLVGYYAAGKPISWTAFIIAWGLSAIAVSILFFLFPYFSGRRKLQKIISAEPKYVEKKKLHISDEGISSTASDRIVKWGGITSVQSNPEFVWFTYADKTLSVIPISAFSSPVERINFIGFAQKEINNNGGRYPTEKPPYALGFLCLIPLIGAFAGLVFIFLGMAKYKDKWFTLMGVAGVLITVIMYSSLFYFSRNSQTSREGFGEISQTYLNSLVAKIEFYKTENGKYPDSLQQLKKGKEIVLIHDPVQINKGNKENLFFYQRDSSRYKLFSRGQDGKPYTEDDLFPQVSENAVDKIGLATFKVIADSLKDQATK